MYVTNPIQGTVSVINSSTNAIVATTKLGNSPTELVYEHSNHEVYIANSGSDTVSILKGSKVVATVKVGSAPSHLAFDPANKCIYVTNINSNSVSVINGSTNHVIATVAVGTNPQSINYDPSNKEIYVENEGGYTVSVISGETNKVVKTLIVGPIPSNIGLFAYDPSNKDMYVTSYGDGQRNGTVSAINSANIVVSTRVSPFPASLVYDSSNSFVYVANFRSDNVSVISS